MTTSTKLPVSVYRTASDTFSCRCQIRGDLIRAYAEFPMKLIASGGYALDGIRAVDEAGTHATYALARANSVYEFAAQAGQDGDNPTSAWDFYGGGHAYITLTSLDANIDGAPILDMPVGSSLSGYEIQFNQGWDILYPGATTPIIGSYLSKHKFTGNDTLSLHTNTGHDHCVVETKHMFKTGYKIRTMYGAMLPLGVDVNRVQIGSDAAITVSGSGTTYTGTRANVTTIYSTLHGYSAVMDLMNVADWSEDGGTLGIMFIDTAGNLGKVYNYTVNGASPIAATSYKFITRYRVSKA